MPFHRFPKRKHPFNIGNRGFESVSLTLMKLGRADDCEDAKSLDPRIGRFRLLQAAVRPASVVFVDDNGQ